LGEWEKKWVKSWVEKLNGFSKRKQVANLNSFLLKLDPKLLKTEVSFTNVFMHLISIISYDVKILFKKCLIFFYTLKKFVDG